MVYVVQPVDYDSLVSTTFNLTVYVADPDTSHVDMAHVELRVTDANDNAPVFSPNQQRITVYENVSVATTLYRFSVNDRDTGLNQQFRWSQYSYSSLLSPQKRGNRFSLALVCVSVCWSVTTITKKVVDGFSPNFMGRFLGGTGRPSSCFVAIGRGMWKKRPKKLRKPAIVYKIAPSGNSKLAGRKIVGLGVASTAKYWRQKRVRGDLYSLRVL